MSEKPFDTGLNFEAIRTDLEGEAWEEDCQNPGVEVRRVFLGTVFSLCPSGKYYTPFARGNVAVCPACKGAGAYPPHRKRRVVKKWKTRTRATIRKFERMDRQNQDAAARFIQAQPRNYRLRGGPYGITCTYCGGEGSREAYLDSCWYEALEEGLREIGAFYEHGEGDPCDIFAVQCRDISEEEVNAE